jgi:SAM-dependent methyltransferase
MEKSAPMNAAEDQTKRWNSTAGRAWVDTQAQLDRLLKPFEELLVDAVAAHAPGEVLDVGCGTGGTTVAIARRLGATATCTGVDISVPMIEAARARAEREAARVAFIVADAQTHNFEPARFDAIVSRFGVMFFSDPVAAFANLRQAGRDDARLQVIVWRGAADNPFMTTAERAAAPFLPNLPDRKPDAPGQFALANDQRVRAILGASGWSGVEVRPLDVICEMPAGALVTYVSRMGPVGTALQEADEATRARVVNAVVPAFEPFVHGNEVRFTAGCWMVTARARVSEAANRAADRRTPAPG